MNRGYEEYKYMVEAFLSERFQPADDGAEGLREAMRYSLLAGGKRIRPILCLEFMRLCGGDPAKALPAACGIEMLHTYSLIHDDLPCMDDDGERRGKPTNHKVFGEATAVLAGDCLQAEAFRAVCDCPIGEAERARCCALLSRAAGILGICGGQFLDLSEGTVTAETLAAADLGKTAALMGASCAMGAAAAGAQQPVIDAAEAYGMALGMAFQCRDDMLDGDGFCALLGAERCAELTRMYTDEALRLLGSFGDIAFLRELTETLCGRNV